MRNGKVAITAAVVILVLAGCSQTARRARMAKHARDDLLGLTRNGLIGCAGEPVKQERIGDREFLTYVSDPALEPDSCVATFVLRRELVDRLDFSSPAGMLPKMPGECAYIIATCMPMDDAVKAGTVEEPQAGS